MQRQKKKLYNTNVNYYTIFSVVLFIFTFIFAFLLTQNPIIGIILGLIFSLIFYRLTATSSAGFLKNYYRHVKLPNILSGQRKD